MITVCNIKLSPEEGKEALLKKACKKLRIETDRVKSWKIIKESLDARKKGNIFFIYSIAIEVENENKLLKTIKSKDVFKFDEVEEKEYKKVSVTDRPVVIGFGPCGMFAALTLAQMGFKPIVIERGKTVDERTDDIEKFWSEGTLSTESNVQFGEGGAGTFSDGKLTSRSKDERCAKVFKEFVKHGAPEEIMYVHNPHIGTDLLRGIVKDIRNSIIALGGEVHFNSKVTDVEAKDGKLVSITINGNERIECKNAVLALGHSARDTFEMLHNKGMDMSSKPFAVGVRIEHRQKDIDITQFGKYAGNENLGPAEYKLTFRTEGGRGVYTFCMCPGGDVVAAASEEGRVCVNGMSNHKRNGENANSALLVQVNPEDFGRSHPLAGMYFQRELEEKAFKAGGGNYNAPAQKVGDFISGVESNDPSDINATYRPGITFCDLNNVLPQFISDAIKEALPEMGNRLKGFDNAKAILTAVESRSSSPVRLERRLETGESLWAEGLYPSGEGAGYAGGIVSAAIDGIRAAEKIYEKYSGVLPEE